MSEKPPISGEPSGDASLPDEIWEQFVRDTEQDIRASAPKEPSARARMVAERLRRQDEASERAAREDGRKFTWRGTGARKDKRRGTEPAGWRTGPAWQEMNGRADRRRRMGGVLGILGCVALLLVALNPSRALSLVTGGGSSDGTPAAHLPPETAAPTAAPASFDPDLPTLTEPFRGSPALQYADGAAGIEVPEATAVGGLSKEEVATALNNTRALLVDADLAPATLRGARPETALGLIDPEEKDEVDFLNTSLAKPDKEHDPLSMFSRFNPKEVVPVGDVVKTRGRMTFAKADGGGVAVHADYTFVYPLKQTAPGSETVARTIVRRVLDVEAADPAVKEGTAGKLWIVRSHENIANSACGVNDGYLHPDFHDATTASGPAPSGSPVDPYDRRELSADRSKGCHPVSRT
ncbi:hypothetical protein ACFYMW_16595 [Streptomyces sp. NPDC006692]|uniref:hypothetical protein n=1 Tax=unclassified Streptomyces TaxID=2593676 RepID=UPI0036C9C689